VELAEAVAAPMTGGDWRVDTNRLRRDAQSVRRVV
jgi:hypothetical protein